MLKEHAADAQEWILDRIPDDDDDDEGDSAGNDTAMRNTGGGPTVRGATEVDD